MSKELEALEKIGFDYYRYNDARRCCENVNETDEYNIIENALKDLEWLKSKLDIDFINRLSVPEDKIRLLKIMGLEVEFNE